MSNTIDVLINAAVRGRDQVRGLTNDLSQFGSQIRANEKGLKDAATDIAKVTAALAGVAFAAKKGWDALKDAAAIEFTAKKFDNLAASIGSTSDALLGKMQQATMGMVSDLELMASASELVSLGLTKTEDETVRLASVAGQLNWNMQQVVLTMANMSTMRLDALGLSVEEVTGRAKELEAAGMAAQEAFKMAVIEAGEAKLGVLGLDADSALGDIKQVEAAWANFVDGAKVAVLDIVVNSGALSVLDGITEDLNKRARAEALAARAEAVGISRYEARAIIHEGANGVMGGDPNWSQDLGLDELERQIELIETARQRIQAAYQFKEGLATQIVAEVEQADPMAAWRRFGRLYVDGLEQAAAETEAAATAFQEGVQGSMSGWRYTGSSYVNGLEEMGAAIDEITIANEALAESISSAQMKGFADIFDDYQSAFFMGDVRGAGTNVNDEGVYRAIINAAMDAGQAVGPVMDLATAFGLMNDEAIQAAQYGGLIDFAIKNIAAGAIPTDEVKGFIDGLIDQIESGMTMAEIEIEVAANLKPKVSGYGGQNVWSGAVSPFAMDDGTAFSMEGGTPFNVEGPSAGDIIRGQFFEQIGADGEAARISLGLNDDPARAVYNALIDDISGTAIVIPATIEWSNTTPPIDGVSGPVPAPATGGAGGNGTPGNQTRGNGVNVAVYNYVDGGPVARSSLDDITQDGIKGALASMGVI